MQLGRIGKQISCVEKMVQLDGGLLFIISLVLELTEGSVKIIDQKKLSTKKYVLLSVNYTELKMENGLMCKYTR